MLSQKLFRKLFRWSNKVALFAILFASLAPSISHALQANSGAGFVQEICTTSGEKITIQVLTTKGQQVAAEFSVKKSTDTAPAGIQHHLNHCPFCAAGAVNALPASQHAAVIVLLETVAKQITLQPASLVKTYRFTSPPSHAPPAIL